jgi:hypothetical protein
MPYESLYCTARRFLGIVPQGIMTGHDILGWLFLELSRAGDALFGLLACNCIIMLVRIVTVLISESNGT